MNFFSTPALALYLLAACKSEPPRGQEPSPGDVPAPLAALGIQRLANPQTNLYTSGQPSEEQLEGLAAAGVRRVIHLRPGSERGTGWEEQRAGEFRLDFVRLPINGKRGLSFANVRAFAAALADGRGQPTLVSCASSNRCGAMLALKAGWIDGLPPDEALGFGRRAGLTRLESTVRQLLAEGPTTGR